MNAITSRPVAMRLNIFLMTAVLSLLNGCSEEFLRSNSSPAYADGYRDGCANGSSTASNENGAFVRDDKRYLNEPEYATGWRTGDRKCNGAGFKGNPNDPMQPIEIDGPQGVYGR